MQSLLMHAPGIDEVHGDQLRVKHRSIKIVRSHQMLVTMVSWEMIRMPCTLRVLKPPSQTHLHIVWGCKDHEASRLAEAL